jgi:hypothetical protein
MCNRRGSDNIQQPRSSDQLMNWIAELKRQTKEAEQLNTSDRDQLFNALGSTKNHVYWCERVWNCRIVC